MIVAHVLSRWAILPVGLLPPAKPGGAGGLLRVGRSDDDDPGRRGGHRRGRRDRPRGRRAHRGAAALVLHRTLGGITGDGYGATAKLTEVVVCVTLVAFWG